MLILVLCHPIWQFFFLYFWDSPCVGVFPLFLSSILWWQILVYIVVRVHLSNWWDTWNSTWISYFPCNNCWRDIFTLYEFGSFVKNSWVTIREHCFWTVHSVPMVSVSIFMPVSCWFRYSSLALYFEVRWWYPKHFSFCSVLLCLIRELLTSFFYFHEYY